MIAFVELGIYIHSLSQPIVMF